MCECTYYLLFVRLVDQPLSCSLPGVLLLRLLNRPFRGCRAPPPFPSLGQVCDNHRLMVSDYGLLPVKHMTEKSLGVSKQRAGLPPASGVASDEATKAAGARATARGEECWVAPEVLQGEEHTNLSDLYSYGGVLFEVGCLFFFFF